MSFPVLIFLLFWASNGLTEEMSPRYEDELRIRRQINSLPLVYPFGGTYKLLLGMAIPIKAEDMISLALAVNFQYQYVQFTNISELSRYYAIKEVSREEREANFRGRHDERLTFYKSAAQLLDYKGWNGYDCVLRAICEAAQYPVEEEGLVGEIIHIVLTPDYGRSPFDEPNPDWEESMSAYKDAATAGRQMFSCPSIYTGCPEGRGVMEFISYLTDQ